MGRIVITEFVSVDGVMEDPGGSEGSKFGPWSFRFDRGAEGNQFKIDELAASDSMLLGRVTYEGFAKAWPQRSGDDFSAKMNSMRKYVVSSTLTDADATWNNTKVLRGDFSTEVAKLRAQHAGDVIVHGSAKLVQGLIEHDLVDELRLMVFPIILGSGKRLYSASGKTARLELTSSKALASGRRIQLVVATPALRGLQ